MERSRSERENSAWIVGPAVRVAVGRIRKLVPRVVEALHIDVEVVGLEVDARVLSLLVVIAGWNEELDGAVEVRNVAAPVVAKGDLILVAEHAIAIGLIPPVDALLEVEGNALQQGDVGRA